MSNTTVVAAANGAFVARANVYGTIIWTAPVPSASQADAMAQWVSNLASQEPTFRSLACRLSMRGAELVLNPDFHGDSDTWTIRIKQHSWLEANANNLAALH